MSWLRYKIVDDYAVGIFENGKEVKFDIEDLEQISSHQWFIDSLGYPASAKDDKTIRLHNLLLGHQPKGLCIDHINRNRLDNRRCNLRVCTYRENVHNSSLKTNNTSGVTGVFYDKRAKRWRAQIYIKGKTTHVGIFDDFKDAVNARKKAEQEYYERA